MIKGTARSYLLGSLIVSAVGFSACSDDDIAVSGSGGADANGGAAIGSGGKAIGGTTGAKAGATSVGGGAVTDTGGATGVGGGTAGGTATGTGGATGVGGGTAGGTATGTGGATGVGGGTVASGGAITAGSAGRSASGGIAGSSGTGIGGSTVTIGVAGAPQTSAIGVAVLTTPLASLGQGQRYNFENYDGKGTYDLSSATLNILACAPGAIGGDLHIFFTSYGRFDSATIDVPLSALTSGFTTISIQVPRAVGSYDPAVLIVTRIEVEAGTGFGTSWQTPSTIVYIDRIWASNGAFDETFTDNYTAGTVNTILTTSGVRNLTGSTTTWLGQVTVSSGSGGAGGTGGQTGIAGSANVAGNTNIAGNLGVAGSISTAGNAGSISGGGASAGAGG